MRPNGRPSLVLALSLVAALTVSVPSVSAQTTGLTPAQVAARLGAQDPTPTPAQAAPIAPAYTIKAGVQLVILDVVVKDKHGQQIHGLTAADFTVKENGHPQQVQNFEEHKALSEAELYAIPDYPRMPPGEFSNFVPAPPKGALTIILIDEVNTALKDQIIMRKELLDYLRYARPDARTAIYAMNNHLLLLQGFTSNPAVLYNALTERTKPLAPVLHDDVTGGVTASLTTTELGAAVETGSTFTASDGSTLIKFPTGIDAFEQPIHDYQEQQKSYITLDNLNDLARILVAIPGRKNLVWFSGDFPPQFFPSENSIDGPYATTAQLDNEFRDTVNLLSRAQVAVYPIDAQGLRTDQTNSPSHVNRSYADGVKAMTRNGIPETIDHAAEFALTADEHMAMTQIAHDTGGEAFANTNDLAGAVDQAVADGSNYYTLTYVPSGDTGKDGLRAIKVDVGNQPFQLSYRHGYFSDHSRHQVNSGTSPTTAANALDKALQFGAPEPVQILLRTRAVATSTPDQPSVLKGNDPNPDPKLAHAPYRAIRLDTAASIAEMSFNHIAEDTFRTNLDFVICVYDARGNLINTQSNTIAATYTREKLTQAMRSGLHFGQQISVPAHGNYFLRVAVHDTTSGRTGAIEIPTAGIRPFDPDANPATTAQSKP